jgi:hypothetical protein
MNKISLEILNEVEVRVLLNSLQETRLDIEESGEDAEELTAILDLQDRLQKERIFMYCDGVRSHPVKRRRTSKFLGKIMDFCESW